MKQLGKHALLGIVLVVALDAAAWYSIVSGRAQSSTQIYFLNVGQGDAALTVLKGGARIMTDAGPDSGVVRALERAVPDERRYVDIGIISHPQKDHFGGFSDLLDRYRFGAFIMNGRSSSPPDDAWDALVGKIRAQGVPIIIVRAGDRIRYGETTIDILSPDETFVQSGELNDAGIVELLRTPSFRALFTADTGENVERVLVERYDLRAHVLKIGHHGSKYSSGEGFLRAVDPQISVVSVGAHNRYGHPSSSTLDRIATLTSSSLYRTDRSGTVTIEAQDGEMSVFTER